MAGIRVVKDAIMICRAANITPFLWGYHGLGKSSLFRQLTDEMYWGLIDQRLSMAEASDLKGFPATGLDQRTHFYPPASLPVGGHTPKMITVELAKVFDIDANPNMSDSDHKKLKDRLVKCLIENSDNYTLISKYDSTLQRLQPLFECGILLLDEMNRAQDDVIQAAFQLVLDRRVEQYVLPVGWSVAAAGNFMEGYLVNNFNDAAFLDRFCHLTLSSGESTFQEWVIHMATVHGEMSSDIIEFAAQNIKHLDGAQSGEMGFSIQPSRRSWDAVIRVMRFKNEEGSRYSEDAYREVLAGLVGRELAISFTRYKCPVKPRNVLDAGVKANKLAMSKLDRNQLVGLMWGMVGLCKDKVADDHVGETCLDFAEFIVEANKDRDLAVAFCRALLPADDTTASAFISNHNFAKLHAQFMKRTGNTKKNFIDRLNSRPKLQKMLSDVSWGQV